MCKMVQTLDTDTIGRNIPANMKLLQRLRQWTLRLPNFWGLSQAEIHSSLLLTLGAISVSFVLFGTSRPGLGELISAAFTMPIVWLLSIAVRVAAQQLVIGDSHLEMETTIGPTGNLSTDYEYLPAKRMLIYSLAGQLATAGLALLGFVVSAAMIQADAATLSTPDLLDLKGGWTSQAWASQIMWVNIFLFSLHLLPTVPFDMRATLFALFSMRHSNSQEPHVFRNVAGLVSRLSTFLLGVGMALMCVSLLSGQEITGWYCVIAASVYLFVAGQWESSRAESIEEQYAPVLLRKHRPHAKEIKTAHTKFRGEAGGAQSKIERRTSAVDITNNEILMDAAEETLSKSSDVDEILRKLHREGLESLSQLEQDALLSASRRLKAKRGQSN